MKTPMNGLSDANAKPPLFYSLYNLRAREYILIALINNNSLELGNIFI